MTDTMFDTVRGGFTRGAPEHYARFSPHPDGRVGMDDSGEPAECPRIPPALTDGAPRRAVTEAVGRAQRSSQTSSIGCITPHTVRGGFFTVRCATVTYGSSLMK